MFFASHHDPGNCFGLDTIRAFPQLRIVATPQTASFIDAKHVVGTISAAPKEPILPETVTGTT